MNQRVNERCLLLAFLPVSACVPGACAGVTCLFTCLFAPVYLLFCLSRSVLEKLPQVNRSLLGYVFGMLHCIHTNADVNQMTAANLALCIAPNMLWRSPPCSAEQENQNNLEVNFHSYADRQYCPSMEHLWDWIGRVPDKFLDVATSVFRHSYIKELVSWSRPP